MLEKPVDFWKNAVWSGESKFNLFGSDGKVMVWKTPYDEFDPKCTISTIKHGGDSFMVWSCFIRQKVEKMCVLGRIMDRFYCRDILEQNLQPQINHIKLGQRCIFMHENDPQHTSRLIKD